MIAGQWTIGLFPASGLDNSLFTAVLLGLLLLFLLNESLGWVFTGLVVPGYLASVAVIQPVAGAVIGAEAIATYLVARALSDWISPWMPWNRFFGRERFFLILLCSVAVRLGFESLLLPALGGWLVEAGRAQPGLLGNLYSIGLIVVPLTANMLWKPGLWRGVPQVAIATGAIWLALRFVLIPYTNLSISDFELSYENVALGFVSSPRTYIVLLSAAYLAMRNGHDWGWDTAGIVVLALVALAWSSPLKVLTTVVEVGLLVAVTRALLASPPLRTAHLEGPRLLVLVFTAGFAIKFVACHVLADRYPGLKATDYFGFGYLLPALLALKVLQRGFAAVLLPTLQTSAVALVVGTAIGLGLALLQPTPTGAWGARIDTAARQRPAGGLVAEIHLGAGTLLSGPPTGTHPTTTGRASAAYRRLLEELIDDPAGTDDRRIDRAAALGLTLRHGWDPDSGESYWILSEPPGALSSLHGWGIAVVRERAAGSLCLTVPRPVREPGTLLAGAVLLRDLDARALLVSGIDDDAGLERAARAPLSGTLPFDVARATLSGRAWLELRAPPGRVGSSLVPVRASDGLDVAAVRERIDALTLDAPAPVGPARLELNADALRALLADAYPAHTGPPPGPTLEGGWATLDLDGSLSRVAAGDGRLAARETDLRFVERELLDPMLRDGALALEDPALQARLDATAARIGYRVELLTAGDGSRALLLAERPPAVRGWGALLVRPEAAGGPLLAVPRVDREPRTLLCALHLWRELDGWLLVASGAAPPAGADGGPPMPLVDLFTQVHRAAARAGDEPPLGLQVRGYGATRSLETDVVIASGVLSADGSATPAIPGLRARLAAAGLTSRVWDGSPELVGLRATDVPQLTLARRLDGAPYLVLWVSSAARSRLVGGPTAALEQVAADHDLALEDVWLDRVWDARFGPSARVTPLAFDTELPRGGDATSAVACAQRLLSAWHRNGDPRALARTLEDATAAGVSARLLRDRAAGRRVLWLDDGDAAVALPLPPVAGSWPAGRPDPVAAVRLAGRPLWSEGAAR